ISQRSPRRNAAARRAIRSPMVDEDLRDRLEMLERRLMHMQAHLDAIGATLDVSPPRGRSVPGTGPVLLTPHEACECLGIRISSLYKLLAQGGLPSVKIGKFRRIPAQAVEAFI